MSPRTKDSIDAIQRAWTMNYARVKGDDAAVREAEQLFAFVRSLPPEQFRALVEAKPGGKVDVGYNLTRIASEAMSDDQKAAFAVALAVRNSEFSRSQPMTWAKMDADGRRLLDAYTPEEGVQRIKDAGIKTEADYAFIKAVVATYANDFDEARAVLRAAEIAGDADAIAKAKDRVGWMWARELDAMSAVIPERTRIARILGAGRGMAYPLAAEETFKSRFLGAMRAARVKKTKAEELYSMFEDTMKLGPAGDWRGFTAAYRKATDARFFDKFLEFWKAGLLGWPTQIANIGSNVVFRGLRDAEQVTSVLVDKFFSGVTGRQRSHLVGEIGARMNARRHGLAEAITMLKEDLLDVVRLKPPDIGKKIERGTFLDDPDVRQLYGAIRGKTGEFIRIPFKLLDSFDNFFKHLARTEEYAAQAFKMAQDAANRSTGESASHAQARIYEEIRRAARNPLSNWKLFKKHEAAIKAGRAEALANTFQTALGPTMKKVYQATQAHPSLQFLFPFVKTPYNILGEGLRRTPLGAMHAISRYARGEIDNAKFVEDLVKSAFGTTLMALTAEAALSGAVTGSGPTDPKQVELKKRTGWQPFSIKIGDQYFSYQRMEPFATVLGLAADMAEAWERKDIDTANEVMEKIVAAFVDNIGNKTFLTGIDSFVKIFTSPEREGLSAIRQLQASLVPNIVGVVPVAHAARASDPLYRETEAFGASPWMAQLPGVSKLLEPQRTPTGEVRERKGSPLERLLSPILRSPVETGPVAAAAEELVRLDVSVTPPGPYFRVGQERVYYTPEEREEIAQAQERAMEEIGDLIESSAYQRLPDTEDVAKPDQRTKRDAILQVLNRYRRPVLDRANREARSRAADEQFMASL